MSWNFFSWTYHGTYKTLQHITQLWQIETYKTLQYIQPFLDDQKCSTEKSSRSFFQNRHFNGVFLQNCHWRVTLYVKFHKYAILRITEGPKSKIFRNNNLNKNLTTIQNSSSVSGNDIVSPLFFLFTPTRCLSSTTLSIFIKSTSIVVTCWIPHFSKLEFLKKSLQVISQVLARLISSDFIRGSRENYKTERNNNKDVLYWLKCTTALKRS